jgi:hypothetical protein
MTTNINNFFPKPATGQTGQTLTVGATASAITTLYTSLNVAAVFFDIQTADVYVTFDGTTPSTVNGHLLKAGEKYSWSNGIISAAKFIRSASTDAVIHFSPLGI